MVFLCQGILLFAQAPAIEWQKTYGGTREDYGNEIISTSDGGYIMAGTSWSIDGDITGHHGTSNYDFWIVKISSVGNIQWQKSLGGSYSDQANSIIQTSDGGYVIAGFSASQDGDVTGNHGSYDYWIVKISSVGDIQWQKSLGGTYEDIAFSIIQTSDGGYIVAGESHSNDGDVSGHHGGAGLSYWQNDYWIVKINSLGSIVWQKSLGGTNSDFANSIIQTTDGGYIVAGSSASNDGDVSGHHGGNFTYDYWIVKLSSVGDIQWQKSLGGTYDDKANSIVQANDGGYLIAGNSSSNDGDVSGHHGGIDYDYWIVKINSSGNIQWQKSLGGTYTDTPLSIIKSADGDFLVAGYSESQDGDITGHRGAYDYWLVKINSSGNIQWQKSLGGSYHEFAISIIQTTDRGYVVFGHSLSVDGDVTGNKGDYDMWIVKLSCETPANPTTATASPTNINPSQTSTLTASGCAVGTTYLWKKVSIIMASTPSFTTPALNTTTVYTAYCVNGSCISSGTNVTVTVTPPSPPAILPIKQLAICQNTATITAQGCAGTVNWYRDVNGSGVNNQFLASGNTLTYAVAAEWRQFIRATCTVGGVVSPYSNYSTVQTGPEVTPISDIISPATPISITASGCPAGTTYLWVTGETTPTITKSPSVYTIYQVKCTSATCQSSYGIAYIYVGNVLANNDSYTTSIYTPVSGNFCTNDGALASKTVYVDFPPMHGNVVWDNTGAFTYIPTDGYTGQDSFKYFLNNGSGSYSNYATVSLTIICPTTVSLQSANSDLSNGIAIRQANAATGNITATNKITGTSTRVTFQAKSIILNAGFKADNGTVFKAEVGGCQ